MEGKELGLSGLISAHFDYKLEGVYTAIPAVILKVKDKQKNLLIDVQPLVSVKTREDEIIPESSILNVPMQMPASSVGGTVFPVKAGDNVLLVFSKRAIDNWKYGQGTPSAPKDFRAFNKNDCIAIPCIFPTLMSIASEDKHSKDYVLGDVIIFNQRATGNTTEVVLKANGDIVVNSPKTVTVNCKDLVGNVSQSSKLDVGTNSTITVGNNSTVVVGNDSQITSGGDTNVTVNGNASVRSSGWGQFVSDGSMLIKSNQTLRLKGRRGSLTL